MKTPIEILSQNKYYSRFKLLNTNDKIRVIDAMEEYQNQFKEFYIKKFEEHRIWHSKDENFARAQAILDLMEACNLYTEKN